MKSILKSPKQFAYSLTLPVFVFLQAVLIFPLGYMVYLSTQSTLGGITRMTFVGLKNYREVFTSALYGNSAVVTLVFVLSTVTISTLVGTVVAFVLHSIKRGAGVFQLLFILPLALAPVVTGLSFNMILNPDFGVLNYLLSLIGLPGSGWHTEIRTALLSIVLVDSWRWTPFIIVIVYAALKMLPYDVYEAAEIDGANYVQQLRCITLPLLLPILLIAVLFRFMDAFRSFDIVFTLTKGGPGYATDFIVIRVFQECLEYFRLEIGAAVGIVLLIVTIILSKNALRIMPKEVLS